MIVSSFNQLDKDSRTFVGEMLALKSAERLTGFWIVHEVFPQLTGLILH